MRMSDKRGPAGNRKEVGDSESSRRHPPHVDEAGSEGRVQDKQAGKAPTMPATGHGEDAQVDAEKKQSVDDESMYDRRPEENKENPPSKRVREDGDEAG